MAINMENWMDIYASRQSGKILTGMLSAVENVKWGDREIPCAVVFYNGVKVIIPFSEMNVREDIHVIRSMMGAEIDFVVRAIDTENEMAMASRKYAMELRRKLELPKHKEGDIIQVRVDAVGRDAVYVEAYGIEARIPKSEVDYGFVRDLSEYVQVGDRVLAKIKKLDVENGKITLSIKETKPDPRTAIKKKYTVGGEYLATVTGMDYYGVFVNLEQGIDALCVLPNWSDFNVSPGDKLLVKITKINEKEGKITAKMVRVVKRAV